MAQVKLEKELWEPAEEEHRNPKKQNENKSWSHRSHRDVKQSVMWEFKEEPECREIQSLEDTSSVVHCKKEEPEEVEIKAEPLPQFLLVSVKSEEGEPQSSLFHQTPTEKNREDTGSSDTDDSEDLTLSAERPAPQTQSELREQLHGPAQENNVSEGNKANSHTGSDFGKSYQFMKTLGIHQHTQTGEKPFKCTVCNKGFTKKGHLNEHMRIHTGEKPYTCPFCEKSFIAKRILNEHIRLHTGERPYKCTVCGKDFIRKTYLNEHMKTHTGERPFKCTICEKGFKTKSNLNYHMRFHTGEKSFRCSVCAKCFTLNVTLKRHMTIHSSKTEKLLTLI
uniref:C2H2-type domain-containing protein n=1 Tax=Neogobius melanostomus TaxID=47308 RepID=A0A8C6TWY7_9GOBI